MKSFSTLFILILFFSKPLSLLAQENLFPNPSFEIYNSCINPQSNNPYRLTTDWSQPSLDGTSSKNLCDESFWRPYILAKIEARTDTAAQYILMWYNDTRSPVSDFRSYIVAKLKKPLVPNARYFFRMYMRCIYNNLDGFCKTNNQAIAFSQQYPKDAPDGQGSLNLKPIFENQKIIDTTWTEISGCFTATGGEEYAIIGNFKRKDSTSIQKFGTNANPIILLGAYLIDDVSLVPLNLELPQDTAICEGDLLILKANTQFPATFKWQDGTTTPQYRITKGGTYSVVINYNINNLSCSTEQQITVNILPRYKPLKMVDTTICDEKNILLKVGTGRKDDTITWQDNSRKDTLRVQSTGIYTAKIANACGQYEETYKVNFAHCAIKIYAPNAFSPNGDNQNETFSPSIHAEFPITDYEFAVFNRWGNLIFTSTDQNTAWDGTFKGQPMQSDVYVWFVKIKANVGGRVVEKQEVGDVTILR
jgi:gliding motility-associated-like protein